MISKEEVLKWTDKYFIASKRVYRILRIKARVKIRNRPVKEMYELRTKCCTGKHKEKEYKIFLTIWDLNEIEICDSLSIAVCRL